MSTPFKAHTVGDWVTVTQTVHAAVYHDHQGRLKRVTPMSCAPFVGQIVGATYLCDGRVEEAWDGEYTHRAFRADAKHPVWLVRRGLLDEPVTVPLDGLVAATEHPDRLPVHYAQQRNWTVQAREWAKDWAADVPRDARGRFRKAVET